MAAKETKIVFCLETADDSAFRKKHPGRGTRSRILRYLLKQYLEQKIAVPTTVIKEQFSVY